MKYTLNQALCILGYGLKLVTFILILFFMTWLYLID